MYRLERLQLKDFMSFEELDYTFPQSTAVLIQGKNLTNYGQKSNGSGKSVLQEAIYRCLTGNSIRKGITDKDLINNNTDSCTIELSLFSPILSKRVVIRRVISRKVSEKVSITINAVDQDIATVNDANKIILNDILGITISDLDTSFFINKEKYISFFFIPDSKKKELIGRFSNANLVDGVDRFVNSDLDELKKELRVYEDKLTSITSNINYISEKINAWDGSDDRKARESKIAFLKKHIDDINLSIISRKKSIEEIATSVRSNMSVTSTYEKSIELLKVQIDSFKDVDLSGEIDIVDQQLKEANALLSSVDVNINTTVLKIREIQSIISSLETKIMGAVVCPNCEHNFVVGDSDINVQEVKSDIDKNTKLGKSSSDSLQSAKSTYNEIQSIIKKLNEKKKEIRMREDEANKKKRDLNLELVSQTTMLSSIKRKIDSELNERQKHETAIETYKSQIEIHNGNIKLIEEEPIHDPRNDWNMEIEKYVDQKNECEKEKNLLIARISEVSEWIINFTRFFAHLTNKSLKLLEAETNKFLSLIKSDLSIQIDGVKVLGDGKIKENITPIIMRDGMVEGSGAYGKLSGGEKVRVEISNLLARQSIINESNEKGGLDILWIDEAFDSIDDEGLDILMKNLKTLGKSIFLTTHIQSNFSHEKIEIVKENGISKIKN